MPKSRPYRAVGPEFLDSAPVTGTIRQALPVSAAAAFASLEDPDAWPQWIDAIKTVTWTSPKPFGVGTTRDITMPGGVVSEHFYAWEPGTRMAFIFTEGTIPVFAAFIEDYELIPTGTDSCELVWRYGVEMATPAKAVLTPLMRAGFKRTGTKSVAKLAEYLRANGHKYAM